VNAAHVDDRLVPLLRGELPEGERLAVLEHLGLCADCRAARDDAVLVLSRLASLEPPPIAWSAYRATLRERIEPDRALAPRRAAGVWPTWWPTGVAEARAAGVRPAWRQAAASAALAAGLVAALLYAGTERPAPGPEAVEGVPLAARLDLIARIGLVERLDMLEDLDVLEHLDRDLPRGES
jgi:hypothetical protein